MGRGRDSGGRGRGRSRDSGGRGGGRGQRSPRRDGGRGSDRRPQRDDPRISALADDVSSNWDAWKE